VLIVAYDPLWPHEFEAERVRIGHAFGALALRIDHHGSTAVPGLAAKPIIDIQISVARLDSIATYAEWLAPLGYIHMPHEDDAVCPFFHRPAQWPHTHHIHLVEAGGDEERQTLAFRDYLREHEPVAREYETLKRALAGEFGEHDAASREAYANAKGAFIARVVSVALGR
jgi:GrpB-like predicted nucleotidyltransferase (UPF0157 family)